MLDPIQPMDPTTLSDGGEMPAEVDKVTEQAQELSLNDREWTFN